MSLFNVYIKYLMMTEELIIRKIRFDDRVGLAQSVVCPPLAR